MGRERGQVTCNIYDDMLLVEHCIRHEVDIEFASIPDVNMGAVPVKVTRKPRAWDLAGCECIWSKETVARDHCSCLYAQNSGNVPQSNDIALSLVTTVLERINFMNR